MLIITISYLVLSLAFCNSSSNEDCSLSAEGYCQGSQPHEDEVPQSNSCIRVAALELYRKYGPDCRSSSKLNLEIIEKAAKIAADHEAKMLVLPEDGIMYEPKGDLVNCLEEIPNPNGLDPSSDNPCLSSHIHEETMPILTRLSCLAKKNGIYLIANYGTKQTCQPGTRVGEEACPDNSFFKLNTNVVFDPSGRFIKRYRKYHPFTETEIFDKAPSLEHSYFETPYGRFGIFTCFDLIFKRPAIELVEDYKVDTILFPTWWFDELPILTAIQYQDGWSRANKVNFVSANILRPSFGSVGSAIFSADHILNTGVSNNRTRLLIANIAKPETDDCTDRGGFRPELIDVDDNSIEDKYAHKNTRILASDIVALLDSSHGNLTKCSQNVCCTIDYKLDTSNAVKDKLIVIVRNSARAGFYGWFEQFCVVATINESGAKKLTTNFRNLDRDFVDVTYGHRASFSFKALSVKLTGTTKYLYPFGAHDVKNQIARSKRFFNCSSEVIHQSQTTICEHGLKIIDDNSDPIPVYSFGMYGRRYESDVKPKGKVVPKDHYVPGEEL